MSAVGNLVTCIAVSDLSLFDALEQNLQADVSASLLTELEHELLRVRFQSSPGQWRSFCSEFRKRPLFQVLQLGNFAAWEYSLPASRSLRSRSAYFAREIAEALRTTVKSRILILGAGNMREAEDALHAAHLHHAQFVAIEPDSTQLGNLRSRYSCHNLRLEQGGWAELPKLCPALGSFDLIYSPAWLDLCDDSEASIWLEAASEMLSGGGRLLAANFAPGARDAGWMEACWNWHPHYRHEEDLAHLAIDLKNPGIRGHAVFRDQSAASTYLEIHSL
jgi:hypothetical protein